MVFQMILIFMMLKQLWLMRLRYSKTTNPLIIIEIGVYTEEKGQILFLVRSIFICSFITD